MPKLQANWVHGTTVQPEREGYYTSKARPGFGAHFNSHNGSGRGEWFHFAIPTPVSVDGQRATLRKGFVLYRTELTAKIASVHVYDASKKVAGFDNLSLTGDHSTDLDPQNMWVLPQGLPVMYGIGISILVDFGPPTPDGVPGISFTTAGADFETP